MQYTSSSQLEPAFLPQPYSSWPSALNDQPYPAGWDSSLPPGVTSSRDLVSGSNAKFRSAAIGIGANSQAFILDEYSALVGTNPQDTLKLQEPASLGSSNLFNVEKVQPTACEPSISAPGGQCHCIDCLEIGRLGRDLYYERGACRVSDCGQAYNDSYSRNKHERTHFFHEGKYQCNASNCTRSFKRWDDLVRHASTKHCLYPKQYPCPEIGCNYSGDNGFLRVDKLKSHYKNAHEGKPKIFSGRPARVPQAILPAPDGGLANIGKSDLVDEYGVNGSGNKRVRRF